jgi:GNAT superfamily N-acetyltransferase
LIFLEFDGEVRDHGDHVVARTPTNPSYHWGNFVLFREPPGEGDLERWLDVFARGISDHQPTAHLAFGWDVTGDEPGEVGPFLERGMEYEAAPVMIASSLAPSARANDEVEVRALTTDAEWEAATMLQIASRDMRHGLGAYTAFKRAQMARYRAMSEAGRGEWYGAFLGDELVGDMGLFHDGEGVARYQSVETAQARRRQGVCTRLLAEAARQGAARHGGFDQLVIVAEPGGPAARVYERAGFAPLELQVGLHWWEGMGS